jgi:hypothetical protein
MNIYEYIARSNPQGARMVIQQFGYRITDNKRMGDNLRMLVAQEGEPALREIAQLHPDKDLILEIIQYLPPPESYDFLEFLKFF